jgi:hypothetical protein
VLITCKYKSFERKQTATIGDNLRKKLIYLICYTISIEQVTLLNPDQSVEVCDDQYQVFFPSVFDPTDCQLAKLGLLNFCFTSLAKEENGKFDKLNEE